MLRAMLQRQQCGTVHLEKFPKQLGPIPRVLYDVSVICDKGALVLELFQENANETPFIGRPSSVYHSYRTQLQTPETGLQCIVLYNRSPIFVRI